MTNENWLCLGILIGAGFLKLWLMYRDERARRLFLENDTQIRIMRGVDPHPLRGLYEPFVVPEPQPVEAEFVGPIVRT